jgi:hypothetical protein
MKQSAARPYRDGELEVILSVAPTSANIKWLSKLLSRSPEAIEIVYKIAFEHGVFGRNATAQQKKIMAAKKRVGIGIGRQKSRS